MQVEPTDERLPLAAEDVAASSGADWITVELSSVRRQLAAQAEEINLLRAELETLKRSLWIRRWHSSD